MDNTKEAGDFVTKAISIIEVTDDKIFYAEEQYLEFLVKSVLSSKYSKSGSALFSLMAATNSLKLGIFKLLPELEIFSIKCLYRVLLEHFLKINYIFYRFCKEKTDDVGKDFFLFSKAEDILCLAKSYKQIQNIVTEINNETNSYEIICGLLPEYRNYEKKFVLEKIKEFKNYNILNTLMRASKEKANNPFSFLLSILPEYSELSSFIHGNPNAFSKTGKYYADGSLEKSCISYSRAALNITVIGKRLSLIVFGQIDKKAFVLDKLIGEIIGQFGKDFESLEKILNN